jgi:hypothetical protein
MQKKKVNPQAGVKLFAKNMADKEMLSTGGTSGRGKNVEKGCERVNIVQIWYTHVYKWENSTC